ncbi:MAG TPA: protein kinase [Terriglobales bacterium]|nr:protein kinase [Terriglobales bacterium]
MALRARAPWWIYACAAVFLGYFCLNFVYFEFFGWGTTGLNLDRRADSPVIQSIDRRAKAPGLEPGDVLVSIGDFSIRNNLDFVIAVWNLEGPGPIPVVADRNGTTVHATLSLLRRYQGTPLFVRVVGLLWSLSSLLQLLLAFFIVFSRPHELAARVGALFLAALACEYHPIVTGGAVVWRHLPWPVQGAFLVPDVISNGAWWFLVFAFFSVFPRQVFSRSKWIWLSIPGFAFVLANPLWRLGLVFAPHRLQLNLSNAQVRVGFLAGLSLAGAYVMGGLACLLWSYRRSEVNERRRIRLLSTGAAISLGAFFGGFPLAAFAPKVWARPDMQILIPALMFVFPLCFAYALVKHQLFDVRIMIRQGLQYAVARGVLLYLVPVSVAILVLDLVLHKDQTVGALLSQRGWPYATLGILAAVGHVKRQSWMQALDRRFFRERYNAQQVLHEVVDEIRKASSLEEEAPRAVARMESALHPEFVALLVRGPGEDRYRCIASAPAGVAVGAVDANSKLVGMMRVLGKPLHTTASESSWLRAQLPHEETDFLRQARIELLVPVAMSADACEALLVFGPKRSEEPYSSEDQELLLAIAGALALLLERPATAPARGGYVECGECGECYDSGISRCASDGSQLTPMPFPRTLAGRYRLAKRLGRGGMGTVYRATDTALDREVAIKMLREDLIANPEAAERFRRESRMSASVTHPNLVAIHDFGIESGRGAFLVMELLVGKTLRQQLLHGGRLPAARALDILRGVCAAVEAAHKRGLIHRDLKPENIFLARAESADVPKVLDFGVAKLLARTPDTAMPTADTGDGILLGTAQYMCPEQLKGELVEPSWDLWALAVISYEMLSGVHPFAASTIAAVHSAVLEGRYRPLAETLPDAPSSLPGFFAAAFATDRARRPATAGDLLLLLERSLAPTRAQSA